MSQACYFISWGPFSPNLFCGFLWISCIKSTYSINKISCLQAPSLRNIWFLQLNLFWKDCLFDIFPRSSCIRPLNKLNRFYLPCHKLKSYYTNRIIICSYTMILSTHNLWSWWLFINYPYSQVCQMCPEHFLDTILSQLPSLWVSHILFLQALNFRVWYLDE